METYKELIDYYERHDEDRRLLSQHGSVEYLTTMRYIKKYLKSGMKIIEIGAGTGRYSHALARKGYEVTAVELIEHNIDIFKKNTKSGEKISIVQGNALDLSIFVNDMYDITLLLGPMYHLYTEDDQRKALSEAIRITKKGGIIFAAYCNNDACVIQACFQKGLIQDEHYQKLIDFDTFKLYSSPKELFQMHRKEEIDRLMADFPVKRLHYIGTDMFSHFMKETVDHMNDELFALYLRYHFSICERTDMIGATNHILDIMRKEG